MIPYVDCLSPRNLASARFDLSTSGLVVLSDSIHFREYDELVRNGVPVVTVSSPISLLRARSCRAEGQACAEEVVRTLREDREVSGVGPPPSSPSFLLEAHLEGGGSLQVSTLLAPPQNDLLWRFARVRHRRASSATSSAPGICLSSAHSLLVWEGR